MNDRSVWRASVGKSDFCGREISSVVDAVTRQCAQTDIPKRFVA